MESTNISGNISFHQYQNSGLEFTKTWVCTDADFVLLSAEI